LGGIRAIERIEPSYVKLSHEDFDCYYSLYAYGKSCSIQYLYLKTTDETLKLDRKILRRKEGIIEGGAKL
jgi:hypothetical protein